MVLGREGATDPRRRTTLQISRWAASATQHRDCASRAFREQRIKRSAHELARVVKPEATALRSPITRQLHPMAGAQQIREVHLRHLEELVTTHPVERHARTDRTCTSRQRAMPHLECVRERLVATRRALRRTLEEWDIGYAHPMHVNAPPPGNAFYQLILATRIADRIAH